MVKREGRKDGDSGRYWVGWAGCIGLFGKMIFLKYPGLRDFLFLVFLFSKNKKEDYFKKFKNSKIHTSNS